MSITVRTISHKYLPAVLSVKNKMILWTFEKTVRGEKQQRSSAIFKFSMINENRQTQKHYFHTVANVQDLGEFENDDWKQIAQNLARRGFSSSSMKLVRWAMFVVHRPRSDPSVLLRAVLNLPHINLPSVDGEESDDFTYGGVPVQLKILFQVQS